MKENTILIFFLLQLFFLAVHAQAQVTVSNMRAEQRVGTDLVDIHYDLDKGGISVSITFPIMIFITDGGTPVSSASATGAVGANQSAGANKHIVWDAAADFGMYKGTTNMSFTVHVSDTVIYPDGGDASASGWQVINERWVRNFYDDGAVTMSDRDTGLMWVFDADANGTANWNNAIARCNNLTYAGHSDWFLPNVDQLSAMYSQKAFFADVQAAWYWSSTPYNFNSSRAWHVNMSDGSVGIGSRSNNGWVWPCRSGQ
jgi:hypothetical protein